MARQPSSTPTAAQAEDSSSYSSVTAPTKAGNYTLTASYEDATQKGTVTTKFTIGKKEITPAFSVSDMTKVYDATTAVGTSPTLTFAERVGGDIPTASASFAYDDANVGTGKTIYATNIVLIAIGTNVVNANYSLVKDNAKAVGAEITQADPNPTPPPRTRSPTSSRSLRMCRSPTLRVAKPSRQARHRQGNPDATITHCHTGEALSGHHICTG